MSATTAPTVTLNVTESAATEIKKFMAGEEGLPETSGLRVRVVPGGCSGFQYSLNIEEQSREGDFVFDEKGVRMFVDMFSAQYLNGVEIDYVSGVMGPALLSRIRTPQVVAGAALRLPHRFPLVMGLTGDGSDPVSCFNFKSMDRICMIFMICGIIL